MFHKYEQNATEKSLGENNAACTGCGWYDTKDKLIPVPFKSGIIYARCPRCGSLWTKIDGKQGILEDNRKKLNRRGRSF